MVVPLKASLKMYCITWSLMPMNSWCHAEPLLWLQTENIRGLLKIGFNSLVKLSIEE